MISEAGFAGAASTYMRVKTDDAAASDITFGMDGALMSSVRSSGAEDPAADFIVHRVGTGNITYTLEAPTSSIEVLSTTTTFQGQSTRQSTNWNTF